MYLLDKNNHLGQKLAIEDTMRPEYANYEQVRYLIT